MQQVRFINVCPGLRLSPGKFILSWIQITSHSFYNYFNNSKCSKVESLIISFEITHYKND